MYPTYPSSKFKTVTPSATALSYGNETLIASRLILVSATGNLTCTNDLGDSVIIPFIAGQTLPIVTRYITALTGGGTITVFF